MKPKAKKPGRKPQPLKLDVSFEDAVKRLVAAPKPKKKATNPKNG